MKNEDEMWRATTRSRRRVDFCARCLADGRLTCIGLVSDALRLWRSIFFAKESQKSPAEFFWKICTKSRGDAIYVTIAWRTACWPISTRFRAARNLPKTSQKRLFWPFFESLVYSTLKKVYFEHVCCLLKILFLILDHFWRRLIANLMSRSRCWAMLKS